MDEVTQAAIDYALKRAKHAAQTGDLVAQEHWEDRALRLAEQADHG